MVISTQSKLKILLEYFKNNLQQIWGFVTICQKFIPHHKYAPFRDFSLKWHML